jgi:hypothetical protein
MVKEFEIAINELNNNNFSLVVVKNKEIVYKSRGKSLLPLVNLLEKNPKLLNDSIIADKIVGKAVAIICHYASVKYCYGSIMSNKAIELFNKNDLSYKADKKVNIIKNRDNTDLCPIEKLILEVDDFEKGINKIMNFFDKC